MFGIVLSALVAYFTIQDLKSNIGQYRKPSNEVIETRPRIIERLVRPAT